MTNRTVTDGDFVSASLRNISHFISHFICRVEFAPLQFHILYAALIFQVFQQYLLDVSIC